MNKPPSNISAISNMPQNSQILGIRFNAKEKDYESGYHYYGARYYWSEVLTGWLGVDPLADKYPSTSPYAYCEWNPVKLDDPDGKGPRDRVKLAKLFLGTPYKRQGETSLRTTNSPEALEYMDCSELVCRVMAGDCITDKVEHMTTNGLLKEFSDNNKYEESDTPMPGDIVVWNGHTGIVESYDPNAEKEVTVIHATSYNTTKGKSVSSVVEEQYSMSYYNQYFGTF